MFLKNTDKRVTRVQRVNVIPMAGVIVSRLSSNSFEELWGPKMR